MLVSKKTQCGVGLLLFQLYTHITWKLLISNQHMLITFKMHSKISQKSILVIDELYCFFFPIKVFIQKFNLLNFIFSVLITYFICWQYKNEREGRSSHINLNKLNCLGILIKSPDDVHKLGYCVSTSSSVIFSQDTINWAYWDRIKRYPDQNQMCFPSLSCIK